MQMGRPKIKPGEGKKTKAIGIRIDPDVAELKKQHCEYESWTALVNRLVRERYGLEAK